MKATDIHRDKPYFISKSYGSAVAYIDVETSTGKRGIGSAFHVGDGVFVTARHVVEGAKIVSVATTVYGEVEDTQGNISYGPDPDNVMRFASTFPSEGSVIAGPYYHPENDVDVAALVIKGIHAPSLRLGSHIADEWINDDLYVLRRVLIFGYPPIPFSKSPVLVAARGEVNAVVRKYTGGNIHFAVSAMARGGFSGGPCLDQDGTVLGMIVESLVEDGQQYELGYMAAVSIAPIIDCLLHHNILPSTQNVNPEDNWD